MENLPLLLRSETASRASGTIRSWRALRLLPGSLRTRGTSSAAPQMKRAHQWIWPGTWFGIPRRKRAEFWDLRLNLDQDVSLEKALSELCQRLSSSAHVDVRTELEGREAPLSDVLKHNLLRIAQESLHNAVQHAQPESILVRLQYDVDAVTLRIKDDGCGFAGDGERTVEHGHLGIAGMEERARRLGGRLDICSSPGAGTEVVATFLYRYSGKEPHS